MFKRYWCVASFNIAKLLDERNGVIAHAWHRFWAANSCLKHGPIDLPALGEAAFAEGKLGTWKPENVK